jgi:hypothetical protein
MPSNTLQFERQSLCLIDDNWDKDDEDYYQHRQEKEMTRDTDKLYLNFVRVVISVTAG